MPVSDFSSAEYRNRLATTRHRMSDAGIEVLIVTDPSNMAWLTGYDGWSFYVHQAVILPLKGEPLWWGRTQDKPGAAQTTWLSDNALLDWPEEHVQHPDHHPYESLVHHLNERDMQGALGVEKDNYYFSAKCLEVLQTGLPHRDIIDATGLVNWARAVKSPAELALMRQAGKITAALHQVVRDHARAGMRKCDLVAEVQAAATRGVGAIGGDYPAIAPIAPSGKEASASHLTWNTRPMIRGEATYFELSGCVSRYHAPASRTIFCGDIPADISRAEDAILRAIEDTLAAAKPGTTCEAVADCVYDSFARAGFSKCFRTGYPVGLSYPPDWGERTMSLRPGDTTPLEENMTFHLMPGLWTPEWGIAITESFVVTPDGGRPLAAIPRDIFQFQ